MVLMTISLKSEASKIPAIQKLALLVWANGQFANPDFEQKFQIVDYEAGWEGGKPSNISYFCVAASLFNVGCSNSYELGRGWHLVSGITRLVESPLGNTTEKEDSGFCDAKNIVLS